MFNSTDLLRERMTPNEYQRKIRKLIKQSRDPVQAVLNYPMPKLILYNETQLRKLDNQEKLRRYNERMANIKGKRELVDKEELKVVKKVKFL